MNQEQNNLNQNNFNSQGNNGMPNNESAKNTNQNLNVNPNNGFNQSLQQDTNLSQSPGVSKNQTNIQSQLTPSYPQSVFQLGTQQPIAQSLNTLENENLNVQKSNNKQSNKRKIGLIIGISVVVFLIVTIVLFLTLKFPTLKKDSLNTDDTNYNMYVKIYKTADNKFYYANENEEILSFSNFKSMDEKFHYNVTNGIDLNYNHFLIDINNNYIVKPGLYNYIKRISAKYYLIQKNEKYGIIDYKGNEIIFPQYTDIDYISDSSIGYFIAENYKENKYYLINNLGRIILTKQEKISKYDVEVYEKFTEKTADTLVYDNNVYNMNTGELVVKNLESGDFRYNVFLNYDEDLVTIYDKNFRAKKKISVSNLTRVEEIDDGLLIEGDTQYLIDKNLKVIEYKEYRKKDFDNWLKEEGFAKIEAGEYHTLANGKKYITKIDEENNKIIIYNNNGNYISECKVGNAKKIKNIDTIGNYFKVDIGMGTISIVDINGNIIQDSLGVAFVSEIYDEQKNYMVNTISYYGNTETIFNDNFMLSFDEKISTYFKENGVWILKQDTAFFYNMKGENVETIENVDYISRLEDDYLLFEMSDNSYKVIDSQNKITLEFNEKISNNYIPNSYNETGVGIIELSDGFYSLSGKKLFVK